MRVAKIRDALVRRGVILAPPAPLIDIEALERAIGDSLPNSMREIYLVFNGFVDTIPDELSMITLWDIERIFKWKSERFGQIDRIPVADFYFDAELIVVCMRQYRGSVWWDDRNKKIAPDLVSFCEGIANGEFDLELR